MALAARLHRCAGMSSFYLWPDHPGVSLLFLFLASQLFLYAARSPLHRAMESLGAGIAGAFRHAARALRSVAARLSERNRELAAASGRGTAVKRLEQELRRVDGSISRDLGRYPELHRRLDELAAKLETDYTECGSAPPVAPGWGAALEAVGKMPDSGDKLVAKMLGEIGKTAERSDKEALREYRDATSKRHKILGSMAPSWKEARALLGEVKGSVGRALEAVKRVDGHAERVEKLSGSDAPAARLSLWHSANLFLVSAIVVAIAAAGAFVNFQLIALPMSELVPSGSRVAGVSVPTIAALVLVLMELTAGVFVTEALGITSLFPNFDALPVSRRRIVLGVSLGALFFLAAVESSLAILRERLVEADTALTLSLAGAEAGASAAATSNVPMIGQAVLGFVLPFVLALIAIPLETLLSTGGHVVLGVAAGTCAAAGTFFGVLSLAAKRGLRAVRHLIDVYIAVPLKAEQLILGRAPSTPPRSSPKMRLVEELGSGVNTRAEGRR